MKNLKRIFHMLRSRVVRLNSTRYSILKTSTVECNFFSSFEHLFPPPLNGFLLHCMMPSTALCYDDCIPLIFCKLQNMCVIKVGFCRKWSQGKSINFINAIFFISSSCKPLFCFCWIIAPLCLPPYDCTSIYLC